MVETRRAPDAARNGLLARLSTDMRTAIASSATLVSFTPATHLQIGDDVLFPLSGALSIQVGGEGGKRVEVAMVGREGVVGWSGMLHGVESPFLIAPLLAGEGIRLPTTVLAALDGTHGDLSTLIRRYVSVATTQMAHATYAAVRRRLVERLARWILMIFDRSDEPTVVLTHDVIATALGVRRPSVTVATHELEGVLAIRARRGTISLLDRRALEAMAKGCYGLPERDYDRVLGQLPAGPVSVETASRPPHPSATSLALTV